MQKTKNSNHVVWRHFQNARGGGGGGGDGGVGDGGVWVGGGIRCGVLAWQRRGVGLEDKFDEFLLCLKIGHKYNGV